MASWRDLAAQALPDNTGDLQAAPPSPRQSDLANSLTQLKACRVPRGCSDRKWRRIVADAEALVVEGWAEQALALGWSMLDLFGIGPRDEWEFSGLAVWLRSRRVILLSRDCAVTRAGDTRHCFNRNGLGHGQQPDVSPVLLWHFRRT